MKPLHLPLEGHDLLAVERFKDDTRHMADFLIMSTHCPLGRRGHYIRLYNEVRPHQTLKDTTGV